MPGNLPAFHLPVSFSDTFVSHSLSLSLRKKRTDNFLKSHLIKIFLHSPMSPSSVLIPSKPSSV